VFEFCHENGLIDKAVRYGSEFVKPGTATMRRHRAAAAPKMFEAPEVRRPLEKADPTLKAMILLGNHDLSTLPLSALDLDRGWLTFARPKTGVARRAALWPETVGAIRTVMESRPKPEGFDAVGCVFLTARGMVPVRNTEKSRTDNISLRFANLLNRLGLRREGAGFYDLRRTFRTIADGARDPVASDVIMGHADHTIGGHYRQRVDNARLAFAMRHEDGLVFIDLDHCRNPKNKPIKRWAVDILTRLNSYAEVSPSGTGAHVFVRARKPGDRCKHGDVEMYGGDRFA
jgi:integrase